MQQYNLDIDHDPGFALMSLAGKEMKLDIINQNNVVADLSRQHGDDINGLNEAVSAHLGKTFGIDPPSSAVAIRFIEWIDTIVGDIRKKLNGLPASPSTTPASTPSDLSAGNVQP